MRGGGGDPLRFGELGVSGNACSHEPRRSRRLNEPRSGLVMVSTSNLCVLSLNPGSEGDSGKETGYM